VGFAPGILTWVKSARAIEAKSSHW